MIIRKVEREDNEALASLIRQVFEEYNAPKINTVYSDPTTDQLFETFQVHGAVLWLAEENGQILGCCGIYPTDGLPNNCAELVKFYLSADTRGKGIGRTLMEKSIASAKQLSYTAIYLESFPEFATAVNIYEKQGFMKIDAALGNSGHTACTIWMIKNI
jgi:putative acetyltransferase